MHLLTGRTGLFVITLQESFDPLVQRPRASYFCTILQTYPSGKTTMISSSIFIKAFGPEALGGRLELDLEIKGDFVAKLHDPRGDM